MTRIARILADRIAYEKSCLFVQSVNSVCKKELRNTLQGVFEINLQLAKGVIGACCRQACALRAGFRETPSISLFSRSLRKHRLTSSRIFIILIEYRPHAERLLNETLGLPVGGFLYGWSLIVRPSIRYSDLTFALFSLG